MLLELSRFGPEVQRAAVHLTESRHPLGGSDQTCRIRARLNSGRVLQAEAVDGEPEGACGASIRAGSVLASDARAWSCRSSDPLKPR